MKTIYVNKKSELTERMAWSRGLGFDAYRTRTSCACPYGQNQRYAVLVIGPLNMLIGKIIRCSHCARKGGSV